MSNHCYDPKEFKKNYKLTITQINEINHRFIGSREKPIYRLLVVRDPKTYETTETHTYLVVNNQFILSSFYDADEICKIECFSSLDELHSDIDTKIKEANWSSIHDGLRLIPSIENGD